MSNSKNSFSSLKPSRSSCCHVYSQEIELVSVFTEASRLRYSPSSRRTTGARPQSRAKPIFLGLPQVREFFPERRWPRFRRRRRRRRFWSTIYPFTIPKNFELSLFINLQNNNYITTSLLPNAHLLTLFVFIVQSF